MHEFDYLYLMPLGFGFHAWVDLLSPAVMSYRISLSSFMILSLACV
jgi:hypothetical protein